MMSPCSNCTGDIDTVDDEGQTPLSQATLGEDVFIRLLEMDAHLDANDGGRLRSVFHQLLEDSRAGELRRTCHCFVI